jgi:hypothetical protein
VGESVEAKLTRDEVLNLLEEAELLAEHFYNLAEFPDPELKKLCKEIEDASAYEREFICEVAKDGLIVVWLDYWEGAYGKPPALYIKILKLDKKVLEGE